MSETDKRQELQQIFEDLLHNRNVYFQPPETMKLNYPCIIYFKNPPSTAYANDKVFKYNQSYTVTYVDKDPDSEIPYTILTTLRYSRIDSYYRSDGLNHTKLTIFY